MSISFANLNKNFILSLENVAFPLCFRGVDKQTREKKAFEMLKLVGIEKRYKHKPAEMSGGQQQRVGIARALVTDPSIIFADEPTGNLDSHTTQEVMELIRNIVDTRHNTVIKRESHIFKCCKRWQKIIRLKDKSCVSLSKFCKLCLCQFINSEFTDLNLTFGRSFKSRKHIQKC